MDQAPTGLNHSDPEKNLDEGERKRLREMSDRNNLVAEFGNLRATREKEGPSRTNFDGNKLSEDAYNEAVQIANLKRELSDAQNLRNELSPVDADTLWDAVLEEHLKNEQSDTIIEPKEKPTSTGQETLKLKTPEDLTDVEKNHLKWLHQIIPILETIVTTIKEEQVNMWSEWKGHKGISPNDPRMPLLIELRKKEDELAGEMYTFLHELRIFKKNMMTLEKKARKAEIFKTLPEHRQKIMQDIDAIEAGNDKKQQDPLVISNKVTEMRNHYKQVRMNRESEVAN